MGVGSIQRPASRRARQLFNGSALVVRRLVERLAPSVIAVLFGFASAVSLQGSIATVSGEVSSTDGSPLAGTIRVIPFNHDPPVTSPTGSGPDVPVPLVDGAFAIDLPKAGLWQAEFESPEGLIVRRGLGWVERNVDEFDVIVPTLETVDLRVVDDVGRGLEGAQIWLTSGGPIQARGGAHAVASGRTSSAGRLELLRPGDPVRVGSTGGFVYAEGFEARALTKAELAALDHGVAVVALERGRAVDVLLRLDGQAVAGAAFRSPDRLAVFARTDRSGWTRLWLADRTDADEERPASWKLGLPGIVSAVSVDAAVRQIAARSDERLGTIDFVRMPCRGRLVTERGHPVSNAVVWTSTGAWARSDEDGGFCLSSVRVKGHAESGLADDEALFADGLGWARAESTWAARASIQMTAEPRLRVRAVDQRGASLEGAVVRAVPLDYRRVRGARRFNADPTQWTGATTDAAGLAELFIERRAYDVEVSAPGRRRWTGRIAALPEHWTEHEVVAELPPGSVQEGWVVDSQDRPIAGARIELIAREDIRALAQSNLVPAPLATVTTDAAGRFEFRDRPALVASLAITARGYAGTLVHDVQFKARDHTLGTVTLADGFDLEGRVTDVEGLPIVGASVRILDGVEPEPLRSWNQHGVKTDDRGRFHWQDLAGGERRLRFLHREFASRTVLVDLPWNEPLEVVLTEGLSVPVQVEFADGSAPNSAEIRAMVRVGSSQGGASAELPGGFGTLRRLQAQRYWFQVSADQAIPVKFDALVDEQGHVVGIPPDASAHYDGRNLVVTLPEGVTLEGTVRDADGVPVPKFSVSVGDRWVRAEDGRFTFAHVPRGWFEVSVNASGFALYRQRIELEADLALDIELDRGAALTGRVIGSGGAPVTGATVELKGADGSDLARPADGRSDENGRYRIEGISERSVALHARAPGHRDMGPIHLQLESGETTYNVELSKGVRVHGRVTGLPERLWGRASLQIGHFGRSKSSSIRQDGSYEFHDVSPGAAQLALKETMGLPDQTRTVQIPDQPEFEYIFEIGSGRLTGVVLEDGSPVPGASLWLMKDAVFKWPTPSAHTDDRGTFVFEMLDDGRYGLAVNVEQFNAHWEEIWIDGDQDIVVELEAVRVYGMVTREDGAPIQSAKVTLVPDEEPSDPMGFAGTSAATDDNGFFEARVRAGALGRFHVRVEAPGYVTKLVAMDIESDERLDIVLERGGARIQIQWSDRAPPSDASLALLDSAGRMLLLQDRAAESGWVLEDVPPEAETAVVTSSLTVVSGQIPALRSGAGDGGQAAIPVPLTWPPTGGVRLSGDPPIPPVAELVIRVRDASGRIVPGPGARGMNPLRFVSFFQEPRMVLPIGV